MVMAMQDLPLEPGTVVMNAGSLGTVPQNAEFTEATGTAGAGEGRGGPPLVIIVGENKPAAIVPYIRGLTPDDLSRYLEEAERGIYRNAIPVWRKMEIRDGHLLSVIEKRLDPVASRDWEVSPVDSSPEAQRQAAYLGVMIENVNQLQNHFETLLEAVKYRLAAVEIEWLPGTVDVAATVDKHGRQTTPAIAGALGVRLWPLNPEDIDLSTGRKRLLLSNNPMDVPADKFIIHDRRVARMFPSSILFVMKSIMAGSWLAFGNKFGMPGLDGEAPAGASDNDLAKFYEMLCNWGQNLVAVHKEGYKVVPIQVAGGTGALPYPGLLAWADGENSKIWTGHTLTTDAESGSGTLAGNAAQTQLEAIYESEGNKLADTINAQLCEPAVRFQFAEPLLAHFRLKSKQQPAVKADADIDDILVNKLGMKLPAADAYARYGRRMPEADEEVLEGAPPPPPPPVLPANDPMAGGQNGTPFKAEGPVRATGGAAPLDVKATLEKLSAEATPAMRAAMERMIEPLRKLINGMPADATPEEVSQAMAALPMDAGLTAAVAEMLAKGIQAGIERTKTTTT